MKIHRSCPLIPGLVLAAAAGGHAQVEPPTFPVEASAVVLDVVVRDGEGKMIHDLTSSDFAVFEDGVEQTIDSFQIVSRAGAPPTAPLPSLVGTTSSPAGGASSTSPPVPAEATPAVALLVFDRLSPPARDFARRAALTYVSEVHRPGDVVGVFSIGLTLTPMGPFTTDGARIRQAIERATVEGLTAPPASETRERIRERIREANTTEDYLRAATQGTTRSSQRIGLLSSGIATALQALQIERSALEMERDQQGHATTTALLALARGLGAIRGRKTVVLFSEGLAIPSAVYASFRAAIDAANRANVSFYTVDAAGLRAQSPLHEVREELTRSVERRERALTGGATDVHPMRDLERNEERLRLTPASTLDPLARETGGVFAGGANDVRDWLVEMAEDMRFHYVLSYTPRNTDYDGRFREVEVEVGRRGSEVRSRHGYFARPPAPPRPLRDPTATALAALDAAPTSQDFPLYATALSFPADEPESLVSVFLEVSCDELELAVGEDGALRGDVSFVVRIRDEEGRTFARLARRYRPLRPSPTQSGQATGGLLFHPLVRLPAGHFLLEAAAHDAVAGRTSVKIQPFQVDPPDEVGVRLSSLVVARGVRKLESPDPDGEDPLVFDGSLLQPNLGEPVRKSETPDLAFFFVARGGEPAPEEATVEVWSHGIRVGRHALRLEPPDADGTVRQAGALALAPLRPGRYTLTVEVASGERRAVTRASFRLAE